jgi:CRP/FNR family transcriptional regulator
LNRGRECSLLRSTREDTVADLTGFEELAGSNRLQKIPIFQWLSYEETRALAQLVRVQRAAPGTVLVEENALGQALYLVVRGRVKVDRLLTPGDRRPDAPREVLGHLGEGQLFGEMALLDDLLTSARVSAEEEVELLVIDRLPFEKLLGSNDRLAHKVYRAFCTVLSERLRKTNDLLADKERALAHMT